MSTGFIVFIKSPFLIFLEIVFATQQGNSKIEEFIKPSDTNKKGKQKAKESGHSSLLQVNKKEKQKKGGEMLTLPYLGSYKPFVTCYSHFSEKLLEF